MTTKILEQVTLCMAVPKREYCHYKKAVRLWRATTGAVIVNYSSDGRTQLTACIKKGCRFYFCNNFGKCRPILIILSPLYSQICC